MEIRKMDLGESRRNNHGKVKRGWWIVWDIKRCRCVCVCKHMCVREWKTKECVEIVCGEVWGSDGGITGQV